LSDRQGVFCLQLCYCLSLRRTFSGTSMAAAYALFALSFGDRIRLKKQ